MPRPSRRSVLISVCLGLLLLVPCVRLRADDTQPQKPAEPRVNVILWFDTEDYLLPADDDAAKRLAEMLGQRGIHATFKVVGEKARVLERRGRTDVIEALRKHTIAYHSNYHSVHPTVTEYEADCGFLDGVAEFVRREGPGAADVRRIFGVPTLACYGQPGSSWAAQAIAGLAPIGVAPSGVPCYVDSGNHIGLAGELKGRPFWYENALVVYNMKPNETRMDLHDPSKTDAAFKDVDAIADRLRSGGGGLISIFYHPCEWVHKEFWDGVNFRGGRNPPREQWQPPPQRPPEETEAAFERFGRYIDHIRALPNVHWVTAADLPALYPDRTRTRGASEADLQELATRLTADGSAGLDFQQVNGAWYSPADQFGLFVQAVGQLIDGKAIGHPLPALALFGPDGAPPASREENRDLSWFAFRDAAIDVRDYVRTQGRVPARVFIGPDPVPPADFLVALAGAYRIHKSTGKLPTDGTVRLGKNVELLPARLVAKDTPNLFGAWVIHRPGFRAPKVLEVARLQAWTLKPAATE
jgi:hypothetical protein